MAETKRQSVNSKIATPKLNNPGPGDIDAALAKAIGARIKVTTASPEVTLEGTLSAACPTTNLLIINTAAAASGLGAENALQPANYHILPISRVSGFSITALMEASARTSLASLTHPDPQILKAREEEAIRQMKAKDATRGKGVGKEGQEIFDAFFRTLPARWEGTTMVISDAVRIAKPYRSEDCMARQDQQKALVRVRQVLEDVRKRIQARAMNNGVATPVDMPLKGG
ncbi:MAG: hypothetical protein M1828_007041 [Chrysothrix sp. TS-e1954]|nr:MAG: hypothetical protein M1828_007041 [Chrysothrix sp. TS-e1954]